MATVTDVPRERVALDNASVDRVYLNGYVKNLSLPRFGLSVDSDTAQSRSGHAGREPDINWA